VPVLFLLLPCSTYPAVVTMWLEGARGAACNHAVGVLISPCTCPPAADLFTALDAYLRKERVRFTELFRYYDKDSEWGGYMQHLVTHSAHAPDLGCCRLGIQMR
jgi:hypothetical protein